MTLDDVMPDPVDVWPENRRVVRLFTKLGGQWRVTTGGATGLDYALALALMERMQLDHKSFDEMLDALGVLEIAALNEMNQKD